MDGTNETSHWGREKMAAISQTTVSNAFSRMKMFEFRLKFHLRLFLRVHLTSIVSDNCWAPSHYLNQRWPRFPIHICVTRPQWVEYAFLYDICSANNSRRNQNNYIVYRNASYFVILILEYKIGICLCMAKTQCPDEVVGTTSSVNTKRWFHHMSINVPKITDNFPFCSIIC